MASLTIFAIACLTDYLDGKIARHQGVTDFGKFMDPIADRTLMGISAICFALYKHIEHGLVPIWMVVVMVGRDIIVSILAVIFLMKYRRVASPSLLAKYRTPLHMLVIGVGLISLAFQGSLGISLPQIRESIEFLMYVPLVASIWSGVQWCKNIFQLRRT